MEQTRIKEDTLLKHLRYWASILIQQLVKLKGEKTCNVTLVNLPIPTTHAMRIIIQFKTFFFSSIIVVDIHSFIYSL